MPFTPRRPNASAGSPAPSSHPTSGLPRGFPAAIVRGLTVNVGGAILGVRGLHEDDKLGQPPTHDEDPFRLSQARVLFLGVGYNFK